MSFRGGLSNKCFLKGARSVDPKIVQIKLSEKDVENPPESIDDKFNLIKAKVDGLKAFEKDVKRHGTVEQLKLYLSDDAELLLTPNAKGETPFEQICNKFSAREMREVIANLMEVSQKEECKENSLKCIELAMRSINSRNFISRNRFYDNLGVKMSLAELNCDALRVVLNNAEPDNRRSELISDLLGSISRRREDFDKKSPFIDVIKVCLESTPSQKHLVQTLSRRLGISMAFGGQLKSGPSIAARLLSKCQSPETMSDILKFITDDRDKAKVLDQSFYEFATDARVPPNNVTAALETIEDKDVKNDLILKKKEIIRVHLESGNKDSYSAWLMQAIEPKVKAELLLHTSSSRNIFTCLIVQADIVGNGMEAELFSHLLDGLSKSDLQALVSPRKPRFSKTKSNEELLVQTLKFLDDETRGKVVSLLEEEFSEVSLQGVESKLQSLL